jgi:hypothetical protein
MERGINSVTFTKDFLERCTKDPFAVTMQFNLYDRTVRLIAGLAQQCLDLERQLATLELWVASHDGDDG